MASASPPDEPTHDARWRLRDADQAEAAAFSDLPAVLSRREDEPCAPPNRHRVVHRVHGDDGRTYYLKCFARTPLKNRITNAWSSPRCRLDAQREALVAGALRSAGFAAPRVVAVGTSGPRSFCMLAQVRGEELRTRIATGRCPRALAERVARHCGAIGRAGITLPDLSALHVFVDGEDPGTAGLTVIDLHRGACRRPRRRDLVRMLRSFARSVAGLAVTRAAALRFAVRLLRAADTGVPPRAIVSRLPPFDTHGRYDAADRARRYGERDAKRAGREVVLLDRVWPGRVGDVVLDVPCGRGRFAEFARARGAAWIGADRSRAMLAAARDAEPAAGFASVDATALPFADRAVDGVVTFRFLHHVDDEAARRVCQEAARVSARFVVVTFFHPVSAHALQRYLLGVLHRRPRTRFARTLSTVDRWFEEAGFARTTAAAEARYLRDLWIASYVRALSDR
ncbi:MAG: methyltransferase domain-containing protein [Planctomycetota bacterium]